MYSSIEKEDRNKVINQCYLPLFKLADIGIPIGIEASAITLEFINKLDPNLVVSLSQYISDGKIELIGSGYSQVIGPLVPAKVNEWNQKLGLECYEKLLGIKPKLALVNEMAYSGGIVEHYCNAGYEGLIMEWNNPRSAHPEWENKWRYLPQKAIGADGRSVPVIWADSIAFQKFQRYAHAEYGLDEYLEYLKSYSAKHDHFFPLYCNDAEIFDYRPNRYDTEVKMGVQPEYDRILNLYCYLEKEDWAEFVFPSGVLDGLSSSEGDNEINLESPGQPIPVKKQEKYNINRWALTGRDDLSINTKCYQISNDLMKNENTNSDDWKELCYLWSSDFRTHITEKRWVDYQKRLENACDKWVKKVRSDEYQKTEKFAMGDSDYSYCETDRLFTIENDEIKLVLNKYKGITFKECVFKRISEKPLIGTLEHGYFDNISLGADYYSGHAVIERPGDHKITDLGKISPEIIKKDNCITLKMKQDLGNYKFRNSIQINSEKIILEKEIETNTPEKLIIRPYNFTFNPTAWDRNSLYIETHNGGNDLEKFHLKRQNISHGDIYSSLISSRDGYGNTEGMFIVGDKDKKLTFICDMSICSLIPSISYKEIDRVFFLRLQYSAQELDETLKSSSLKQFYHLVIDFSA